MNARTAVIMALALTLAASSQAIPPIDDNVPPKEPVEQTAKPVPAVTDLATAVEIFNTQAQKDAIGKTQPPLTVDEVVGSIRGISHEDNPRMSKSVFLNLQDIAETQELPEGSGFSYISQWGPHRGYDFDVWWIDLSVLDGNDGRYIHRLRKRMVASRIMQESNDPTMIQIKAIQQAARQFMSKLTPEERARVQEGDVEFLKEKMKQHAISE